MGQQNPKTAWDRFLGLLAVVITAIIGSGQLPDRWQDGIHKALPALTAIAAFFVKPHK